MVFAQALDVESTLGHAFEAGLERVGRNDLQNKRVTNLNAKKRKQLIGIDDQLLLDVLEVLRSTDSLGGVGRDDVEQGAAHAVGDDFAEYVFGQHTQFGNGRELAYPLGEEFVKEAELQAELQAILRRQIIKLIGKRLKSNPYHRPESLGEGIVLPEAGAFFKAVILLHTLHKAHVTFRDVIPAERPAEPEEEAEEGRRGGVIAH